MKSYYIGDGVGLDGLTLIDRPEPNAAPGRVVVRMRAFSLNFRDLEIVHGRFGPQTPRHMVPVSDGVGEVVAVGEGVTRFSVGDRVSGNFMQEWVDGAFDIGIHNSALGGPIDGVLAEYVAFPEHSLVKVPAYLTDEEAATLPCAAVTVWNALFAGGNARPGQTIVIQGTGGVSIFALQFAKLAGLKTIVTSSSDAKLARVVTMGADAVINYRTTPDWDHEVLTLTDGRGADIVLDVSGEDTIARSINAARSLGDVPIVGFLSGKSFTASLMPLLLKNVIVRGVSVGSRRMFEQMNEAISHHELHPVIDRVFEFEEARAAYEYLESGKHFGKVVIRA
ncbi:NADPH:quinone oxidoreductase [Capsulimonas corticalis]|uniref:NADPH:quinone oxidoreductase n=1 Tax=Capsulimonas corticalis TaxID=2219043 RepID=A0A402CQJ5_9BACT|nr:NAD(P)-dependent alcohol dehydrogenase [Capsulimonas corticalis]BDI34406.1 NADPH:quinone oxidoreductase [Capsulimonas corticalis]